MSVGQRRFRVVLYLLWGVLMTALTFVLAGLPLKSLRRGAGRLPYWAACLAVAAVMVGFKFYFFAATFLSLVILIGLFCEFEELGLALVSSSFFTLLITGMLSAGVFAVWVSIIGPSWNQTVLTFMQSALDPLAKMNEALKLNYDDVMMQLPSLAVILWMVTLYVTVLLEPRLSAPSAEPLPPSRYRDELGTIRIPDVTIWLFIVALLGTFGTLQNVDLKAVHVVSINLFNVCLVAFFFQGLAVVSQFFDWIKMGWIWQTLLMILIVLQLFVFVSLLGLIDHWLDFRTRMEKRRQQIKREI